MYKGCSPGVHGILAGTPDGHPLYTPCTRPGSRVKPGHLDNVGCGFSQDNKPAAKNRRPTPKPIKNSHFWQGDGPARGPPARLDWPVKHSGRIACKRQHGLPCGGRSPERGPPARLEWPVKHSGLIVCKRHHGLPCGGRSPARGPPARLEWPVKHNGLIACNRQHGLLSRVGSAGLGGQSGIWIIVPLLVHRTPKAGREARAPGFVRFEWPVKHSGHIACKRQHGLPCGGRSPERGPPGPLRVAC